MAERKIRVIIVSVLTLILMTGGIFVLLFDNSSPTTNEPCITIPLISISAGRNISLVVTKDGSLWGWGQDSGGQLGFGTLDKHLLPNVMMNDVAAVSTNNTMLPLSVGLTRVIMNDGILRMPSGASLRSNILAVSTGAAHTMVITPERYLYALGGNMDGQLGDGTNRDGSRFVRIMGEVIAVSAGNNFTLAITKDNGLWSWGNNFFGQLGTGTTEGANRPTRIKDDVIAVSAGTGLGMAITSDGSLWAWGRAGGHPESGWIGDGYMVNRYSPVRIMDDVIFADTVGSRSFAITSDNILWGWGDNRRGELGDGTSINRHRPVRIMEDVVYVSAGFNHTLAVTSDGALWAWGLNDWGQLGDGTTQNSNVPIRIMDGIRLQR